MDANLFRLPTSPDYYASATVARPSVSSGLPATDSRFPGWAAPLEDARLVTDYRSNREKNIPVESQEKTRIWLQRNGDEIIRISRKRIADSTGMSYGIDQTLAPPAAAYVNCRKDGCSLRAGEPGGIGVERVESASPYLFGTYEPGISFMQPPLPKVQITRHYEGGRNSYRG